MKRREFLTDAVSAALFGAATLATGGATNVFANSPALPKLPKNVQFRGSCVNSKTIFETTKRGRVAFLGGSITEMDGYRPMVCDFLTRKFPETQFDFVAAGISSTCSDVGAFRLETDVLQNGKVDLFFVEFAVNDDQDGMVSVERSIRGVEGIIRRMRAENPAVDIVATFFVNERLMDDYRGGRVAPSIQAHRKVVEKYRISTVDLAKEIQERIDAKSLTWEEFGGVHPAPAGNRICADMIAALLEREWSGDGANGQNGDGGVCLNVEPRGYGTNANAPLDRFSYSNAGFRGFDGIATNVGEIVETTPVANGGFRLYVPNWSQIPGGFRDRFGGAALLCAEKAGATTTFDFNGSLLALYVLAGPDAGIVECQIDGGAWIKADVFHPFSGGLHYPRAVVLADELAPGQHTATIRTASEKNENSNGTALRILQICVADRKVDKF